MQQLTKRIAVGVGTVALVGGIGAGNRVRRHSIGRSTASPRATETGSPTQTPAAGPGDKADQNGFRNRFVRRHLRLAVRALHGEVTLAGEQHRVIAFQRGGVEKVSKIAHSKEQRRLRRDVRAQRRHQRA